MHHTQFNQPRNHRRFIAMETSIFATKNTDDELVHELVTNVDRYVSAEGKVKAAELPEQIKYSRAWLILRRAWVEQHQPGLLEKLPSKAEQAKLEKRFAADDPNWHDRHVLGPIVARLHDEGCSWGEIMIRLGMTESKVRKAFERADGARKSVGLRTGKGGRFVADRPDLYQGNRVAEGAHIPNEVKASVVRVEELLNYVPSEA